MEDFMFRGLMGGVGVALVTGPVGCFIVWRKMAYFGNSMSHTALLGVAIGFAFGIDLRLGILVSCIGLALVLLMLQSRKTLSTDTLLGILAHTALSVGIIAVSVLETLRVDLMGYLFGDILAVGPLDLWWIYLGGAGHARMAVAGASGRHGERRVGERRGDTDLPREVRFHAPNRLHYRRSHEADRDSAYYIDAHYPGGCGAAVRQNTRADGGARRPGGARISSGGSLGVGRMERARRAVHRCGGGGAVLFQPYLGDAGR